MHEFDDNDPSPDIHALFQTFNHLYFDNRLGACSVEWSSRMTLCAGLCYYATGSGCKIRLSQPLLQFRPRSDLINTLLHEMIHALLFLCPDARIKHDHESHGPDFQKHMARINRLAGSSVTVYHTFHDEVDYYRRFVYRCDGPCRTRPPYFGTVRRSMRRQPGPSDRWWEEHRRTCSGVYHRIDNEDDKVVETKRKRTDKQQPSNVPTAVNTLDHYFVNLGAGRTLATASSAPQESTAKPNDNDDPVSAVVNVNDDDTVFIECPCCPILVSADEINAHLDREHFS